MDWLLTNARLSDRMELTNIAIADGRIAQISPAIPATATQRWDLHGRVVLPGLVEPHVHLDKTYLNSSGSFPNRSGTLWEAIDVWLVAKKQRSRADVQAAVRRALRSAIAHGVTAMRSHVDTEEPSDLETLATILEVREEFRHAIDLQIVALGFAGTSPVIDRAMADALAWARIWSAARPRSHRTHPPAWPPALPWPNVLTNPLTCTSTRPKTPPAPPFWPWRK